jgi:filamentous hemagglutinin
VGDFSQELKLTEGGLAKIGLHAIMGGLAAEAAGGDFKSGALVAGANEALIDTLAKQYDNMTHDQRSGLLTMNSQVLGVLVASMAGGDEKDMQTGAWVAGNATNYNYLTHQELDAFEEQARNCKEQGNCSQVKDEFRTLSVALDDELTQLCATNASGCIAIYGDLIEQRLSLQERMAQLSLDSSIPWELRADLHVYQLQNISIVGTLIQTASQLSFEDLGLSSEQAELAATIAATLAAGGLVKKSGKNASVLKGNSQLPSSLPKNLDGYANPADIRFTQNSIANKFKNDSALQKAIDDLSSGKISPGAIPAIRVFEKNGVIYSLDNRRLLVASQAKVPIKIVPATPAEIAKEAWKITTPNDGKIICVRGVCK